MNGDGSVCLNLTDQRQHARQALTAKGAARVITKHLVEECECIEPIAYAARVIKIILNRAASARLRLIPER